MKSLLVIMFLSLSGGIICQTILKEEGVENAYPRLSRDGSRILYQSNRTQEWQLYIRDKDGNETRLTKDTFQNNFPDWSPDNKWIAFVSDRDGNEEIYLMKANGSGIKRLTHDKARDIHPYFSPDGKTLLFNSSRGNNSFDIYKMNIQSGEVTRLTDTPEDETCARYSPDLKKIVFLRNSSTSDDVFLLDVASGITTNLTKTPRTRDGWPMFSADGKWIYYSAMTNGRFCIFRIKPDGTSRKQLTDAGDGEEHARVYIANEGDYFIYNNRVGATISIEKKRIN